MANSTSQEIYDKLKCHQVPQDKLRDSGFPCMDPERRGRILGPRTKRFTNEGTSKSRSGCKRCGVGYVYSASGMPSSDDRCPYHEFGCYSGVCIACCKVSPDAIQCKLNSLNGLRGELYRAKYGQFVEAPIRSELEPNRHGVFAVNTQMCRKLGGYELAHVTIVDANLNVVYDKLVREKDFILLESGIYPANEATFFEVQSFLKRLLSSKSILVGHGLGDSLLGLKLAHKCIVDTAILYHHSDPTRNTSLEQLVAEKLNMTIEEFGPDRVAVARAALRLACFKANATQLLPKP